MYLLCRYLEFMNDRFHAWKLKFLINISIDFKTACYNMNFIEPLNHQINTGS